MDRFQYLVLMGGCVVLTLPLEFVFGARVYRRPRRWLASLAPVVALFYVWDIVAVARSHWWFSPAYTTGIVLPGGVPLEELVFFVVIPTCALLSFEAVRNLLTGQLPPWVLGMLPAPLAGWLTRRRPAAVATALEPDGVEPIATTEVV